MANALVIGKFYPFHLGHARVIETALAENDHVTVLVIAKAEESITAETRRRWITQHFNVSDPMRLRVLAATADLVTDYGSREVDLAWAKWITEVPFIGYPQYVYSSEDYGGRLANDLSDIWKRRVEHRVVDRYRSQVTISATSIRSEVRANWDFLPPVVQADFCKRIVVCGAESTGSSTLAKALGSHYKTPTVPEYGYHFDWAVGKHHKWTHADFVHIAQEQKRLEDQFALRSQPFLICDSDEFSTAMFHEQFLSTDAPDIMELAWQSPADLYLVTDDHGVEFEDDGVRFNSGLRSVGTQWLMNSLPGEPHLVTGPHEGRFDRALAYIESLEWKFYEPLELGKAAA